jgi:hypothetical protein
VWVRRRADYRCNPTSAGIDVAWEQAALEILVPPKGSWLIRAVAPKPVTRVPNRSKRPFLTAGPTVRIRFPPAASQCELDIYL